MFHTTRVAVVAGLALLAAMPLVGEEVASKFVPEGVTQKVGGYRPSRAMMDQEAEIVTKAPEDLASPKYGHIALGDKKWAFILDEPEEGDARLFVDTNADGDLTNDPATEWKSRPVGEYKQYGGSAKVELAPEQVGSLGVYRFDPTDKRRAELKNALLFYADFGYELSFALDGKPHSSFVSGGLDGVKQLPIDRDGNGAISRRFEAVTVGKPFNFTGTTYLLKLDEGKFVLAKSDDAVEQMPLPPDLRVGQTALSFTAKTIDGEEIEFPKQYAGKIVMLDFWATWCGPCIGEIPHMKEAYAEWHEKGFEILGISFDRADMEERVRDFMKDHEITWNQIYEGKYWDTTLGQQHDVSAIPFVLLVDGDTGKILATAANLRGPKLSKFIGEKLEEKQSASEPTGEKSEPEKKE